MNTFNLRVTIAAQPDSVDARHDFASSEDAAVALALPHSGIYHIAHGLLLEAIRRETHLSMLAEITKDPEYINRYSALDDTGRQQMAQALGETVTTILYQGIKKMAPGAATFVLAMTVPQTGVETPMVCE